MVISRRHLAGFRVQGIYSPAIMRALSRPLTELGRDHPPRLWSSRAEAEQAATSWRGRPVTARAEDGSRSFTQAARSLNTRVIRVAPVFSRHALGWC